jgi:hypothetical protein
MTDQSPDLFGYSPRQSDLFANEAPRNNGIALPDPEKVRLRLKAMLIEAKNASGKSPWDARQTRLYQLLFPQMTNCLPSEEAEQLKLEFTNELRRLEITT